MEKTSSINRRELIGGLVGGVIGVVIGGGAALAVRQSKSGELKKDKKTAGSFFTDDTLRFEAEPGWEKIPEGIVHKDVSGVAVDSKDRVLMVTRKESRVVIYEKDGTFVRSFGDGVFTARTHGIAVDSNDYIYVVDQGDNTVRKFSPEGKELMVIGTPGVASDTGYDPEAGKGVQAGGPPFNQPTGASITSDGEIYVSDGYGNSRVHRFAADGKLIQSWGEPGSGQGQFQLPHAVCVMRDGRVFVADRENDRIQIFTRDGKFLDIWPHVQRPTTICEDKDGNIFVSSLWWRVGMTSFTNGPIRFDLPGHVSMFDAKGNLLLRWISADRTATGNFIAPHGVAVDSSGDLYVAEVTETYGVSGGFVPAGSHTFQKFIRKGTFSTAKS